MIVEALLSALARTTASRREQSLSHAPSFVSAVFVTVSVGLAAKAGMAANVTASRDPQASAKNRACTSSQFATDDQCEERRGWMLLGKGPWASCGA